MTLFLLASILLAVPPAHPHFRTSAPPHLRTSAPQGPVRAVDSLDLARYAGLWHEVARFPNKFQDKCVSGTTAEYTLRSDGEVRVVNRCVTASGDTTRAEGRAKPANKAGPASRLKVRFAPAFLSFLSAVWADYWVLDLTEDYSAALVGTPDRRYLWVLGRDPEMPAATWERMVATAAAQGFDVGRLLRAEAAPPAQAPLPVLDQMAMAAQLPSLNSGGSSPGPR